MLGKKVAVGLGAGVAALVLGSAATTGALWNDAVSLDDSQVRSGELSLLNGDEANQTSSYAFTALAGANLAPGSYAQAPLVIANGGTVDARYRLSAVSASGAASVATELNLRATVVSTAANCPTGVGVGEPSGETEQLYDGPLPADGTPTFRPLAVAARETLCLRVSLDSDAAAGDQQDSASVTFTFLAESK